MDFKNILQAISYARATGDTQALSAYTGKRISEAAKRIMPIMSPDPKNSDDIFFLLAYLSALMDVNMASMSEDERALIQSIKQDIHITLVKVALPFHPGT